MVQGVKRQGGARPCTNDLDALNHDRSALSGSKVVEMGAPRRSPHSGQHSRTAPLPSRSLSAPAGGVIVKPRAWFSSHAPGLSSCGLASAAAAPSGPEAGAQEQPEPGSAPSGAQPGALTLGCGSPLWSWLASPRRPNRGRVIQPRESMECTHCGTSTPPRSWTPERTSRRSVRTSVTLIPDSRCGSTPTCSRAARGVPASPWTRCT